MISLSSLYLLAALVGASSSPSEDPQWGGFRGNNSCGVAASGRLPEVFDRDVNLAWEVELPRGYSSPTVAGDRVFVTGAEGRTLATICIDRASGEVVWRREVEFDGSRVGANSSASPTPSTDGERVFALFHHVGLVAYDTDGEELWHNPLGSPYNIPHGMSSSPVPHGDRVVVQIDQDSNSRLVALDKATGEAVWEVERAGVTHGYATPVIYEPEEGPVQVITSGALQIVGYSLEDGKRLWWVNGSAWQVKSVPVLFEDLCIVNGYMVPSSEFGVPAITETWEEALADKDANENGFLDKDEMNIPVLQQAWFVFDLNEDQKFDERDYAYFKSAGSAVGGLFAIKLGGKGDVTDSHLAWHYDKRRGLSDLVSPVVVGDTLFMLREGGLLTAINAKTGEIQKQERVASPDKYYASPVAAGGQILTASESGQLSIIDAKAEWEVVSTADLDDTIWSTPAIVGKQAFVRSPQRLYCFLAD